MKQRNLMKPLPFPVPWVFIVGYLVSLIPQHFVPIQVKGETLPSTIHFMGIILFVVGLAIMVWSLVIFQSRRTTTSTLETASLFVTWGPYRFSRNPMYVSLTMVYLGEAGIQNQIWPILFLIVILAYLNSIVIPYEESSMARTFGDSYEQYRGKVRRWF
jgi:protein-S-isoprenylcysteine O-methyltransferase Ste14